MFQLIVNYINGSIKYAINNNYNKNPENTWNSVCDEFEELRGARNFSNFIEEYGDVCQSFFKYLIITFLPKNIALSKIVWFFMFFITIPASIKLARREKKYGCIRNHARKNEDHICEFNNNIKK